MPSQTGYWSREEAKDNHDFSYKLAKWIGTYFDKEDYIADYGCGGGTYLRYLHDVGFKNLVGFEGEIPDGQEFGNIRVQDLAVPFEMITKADGIICLEVGEHIPKKYEGVFLDNLCNNCTGKILLSWATPFQGGFGHVNCQHNVYIIGEMKRRGWELLTIDTVESRQHVENRCEYFRNTLMIFEKI